MKLRVILSGVALGALWNGASAAEQKTILSQTLNPGEAEAELRLDYRRESADRYPVRVRTEEGRAYRDAEYSARTVASSLYAGVGVAGGLQVTATIPFVFSGETTFESGSRSGGGRTEGFDDLALGAAVQVLGRGRAASMNGTVGVDVKLDTAGTSGKSPGTGTTDYTPYLAMSFPSGKVDPYFVYAATVRGGSNGNESHRGTLGVQAKVSGNDYVDVSVRAGYNTADGFDSYTDYSARLKGILGVTQNVYLTPTFSVFRAEGADLRGAGRSRSAITGLEAGFGFYVIR